MNGFILVFGMVLVLAAERRLAADRAAVGRPPPPAADSPAPWRGAHPQPTAPPVARYPSAAGNPPRPWAAAVPWPGARALADDKMLAKCVPPASDSGKISPRCVFGLSAMAVFRRDAFSGVQSWRDYAVVRSRAAIRGSFFASCVPEGASDGKNASSRQHIAAMYPK